MPRLLGAACGWSFLLGVSVLGGALWSAGCASDLRVPDGTVIRCQSDDDCPPGLACQETLCGGGADDSPPTYLYPPDGAFFATPDVVLQWTSRFGALTYEVEISTDPDFVAGSQVTGSPFATSDAVLPITLDEDLTYWWRVTANVTLGGEYSTLASGAHASFHRLGDAVYVHCPENDTTGCLAGVGNRGAPLGRIQSAIELAESLGIDDVRVAVRGGGQAYDGILRLASGVNVRGGYVEDFLLPPDPADPLKRARLAGGHSLAEDSAGVVAEGINTPTVLEGVSIDAPAWSKVYGMRVVGSQALTLRHSDVLWLDPAAAAERSIGIEVTGSSLRVESSQIAARAAPDSAGIDVRVGALTLLDSEVSSGAGTEMATAVVCSEATVDIDGSTLSAITPTGENAAAVRFLGSSELTLVESALATECGEACWGVLALTGGSVDLSATAVTVEGTAFAKGVELQDVEFSMVGGSIDAVDDAELVDPVSDLSGAFGIAAHGGALTLDNARLHAEGYWNSFGLQVKGGASLSVSQSDSRAGASSLRSYGLLFDCGDPLLDLACTLAPNPFLDVSRSVFGADATAGTEVAIGADVYAGLGHVTIDSSAFYTRPSGTFGWGLEVVSVNATPTITVEHNMVLVGLSASSTALASENLLNGVDPDSMSYNIVMTSPGPASECFKVKNDPATVHRNLVSGCEDALYNDAGTPLTQVCDGNFAAGTDCLSATSPLDPAATESVWATLPTEVFATPGFDASNPATWIIAPDGPADLNKDGVWSPDEPGFEATLLGPF